MTWLAGSSEPRETETNRNQGQAVTTGTEIEKYCVFRQAEMLFALPASTVVAVSPEPVVAPVPAADPVLAGIAHVRNEFLPVISLAPLTGSESQATAEQQLLVVKGVNGAWAILVDRVHRLETLEISNNQDATEADDWTAAVMGSATVSNEVARVLNPAALYRLVEDLLTTAWNRDELTTVPTSSS